MSGHSKWNNIKRKKEKTDAQKAKVFTRIGKEMAVAIRAGGPNPNTNSKLRDLIAKAKANNVPNENIERTIKKFSEDNSVNYEELTYEGYGAAGVAVMPLSSVMATADGVVINHFMNGKARISDTLEIAMETLYPYGESVKLVVNTKTPCEFNLKIREPEFAKGKVTVDGVVAVFFN